MDVFAIHEHKNSVCDALKLMYACIKFKVRLFYNSMFLTSILTLVTTLREHFVYIKQSVSDSNKFSLVETNNKVSSGDHAIQNSRGFLGFFPIKLKMSFSDFWKSTYTHISITQNDWNNYCIFLQLNVNLENNPLQQFGAGIQKVRRWALNGIKMSKSGKKQNREWNFWMPVNAWEWKCSQKFHSWFRFFPDLDISMSFNAHLLTGLEAKKHLLLIFVELN